MTRDEYVDTVIARLAGVWNPDPPDLRDVECTRQAADDCFDQGYIIADAIRFVRCLEHVDETLPEDIALTRMNKYPKRMR